MALGLKNMPKTSINSGSNSNSIAVQTTTLKEVLQNHKGFPLSYIPTLRLFNNEMFIKTIGQGRDVDNKTVYYKWLFITDNNEATTDSSNEYARVPESGYLMRVMQRMLLPFHENFHIDYFEDINNMKVIDIKKEELEQFTYKTEGSTKTFRVGDVGVPNDLKTEIYSYPEEFFNAYMKSCIPLDLLYNNPMNSSNHISSYGNSDIDMGIMSHGLDSAPRALQRPSSQASLPKMEIPTEINLDMVKEEEGFVSEPSDDSFDIPDFSLPNLATPDLKPNFTMNPRSLQAQLQNPNPYRGANPMPYSNTQKREAPKPPVVPIQNRYNSNMIMEKIRSQIPK